MTSKHFRYIATALFGLLYLNINAQLSGSVNVEGEYAPIVVETERLNSLPKGYGFMLPATDLNYDFTGIVTDFRPDLLTMGVTGRLTDAPFSRRHGFIDFNLGSWLDSRLHAGAVLLADSVNAFTADLKFESSSLYRMYGVPSSDVSRKALYDGTLKLDYSRLMGSEGLLSAGVCYRLAYFNYYGTIPPQAPSQTLNDITASINYNSSPSFIKGWHAGAKVNYMAFRRLYSPVTLGLSSKGGKETELNIDGGYIFGLGGYNALSVDVDGSFLFYPSAHPLALGLNESDKTGYGIMSIRPAYRFADGRFRLNVGLDMAVSYDAMGRNPGNSFSTVHLAPDISFDYSTRGADFFLKAGGGVTPSTMVLGESFDLYRLPWVLSTRPIYSPIDIRAGVTVGPFAGFSASATFRYAVARNVPIGGWYQAYLGSFATASNPFVSDIYSSPYLQTVDLHGCSVDLDLRYAWGSMVDLSFSALYTPRKGTRGIFNGFDSPRWILSANAAVRPIKKLKVEAGYDYRGVRTCYAWVQGMTENYLTGSRLQDITDLHAKVSFTLLKNLDIYCEGRNLLDTHPEIIPGLRSEGIVVAGGFYLEF